MNANALEYCEHGFIAISCDTCEALEIHCPAGCGFYVYQGSEGRDEMRAHLLIDCDDGKGI
jgi:hypothetical protein